MQRTQIKDNLQGYLNSLFSLFPSTRERKFNVANLANKIASHYIHDDGNVTEPLDFFNHLNNLLLEEMTLEGGSLSTLGKHIISIQNNLCAYLIKETDIENLRVIHDLLHYRSNIFERKLQEKKLELTLAAKHFFNSTASGLRKLLAQSRADIVMNLFIDIRCKLFKEESRSIDPLETFLQTIARETLDANEPDAIPPVNFLIDKYNDFIGEMARARKLSITKQLARISPPTPGLTIR